MHMYTYKVKVNSIMNVPLCVNILQIHTQLVSVKLYIYAHKFKFHTSDPCSWSHKELEYGDNRH